MLHFRENEGISRLFGSPPVAMLNLKDMLRAFVLACLAFTILLSARGTARAGEGKLSSEREAVYARYAERLTELATWCQEQKLADEAKQITGWLPKRAADRLTLFVLPPSESADVGQRARLTEWRSRWQKLRDEQADALVALAQRAAADGEAALAMELVTEAVRENPDHKQARRILGFVKYQGNWQTPFAISQLGAGKVWNDKFGWIPKSHQARYEQGQRYYQGRWMSADDEKRLRSDLKRGWRVESDHYTITTNHSLEEGVQLSRRLETLYSIWRQVFASYLDNDAELARRFAGRSARRERVPHQVVYFANREQYTTALKPHQPKIDMTLGIYFDSTHTAYFFAGDEQEPGTIYHEATHQLFQESRPVVANVARDGNFWVVEGVACYMESLAEADGYWTLGGADAGRMPAARHRLLTDDFYVPLEELTRLGMEPLQHDPRIARLYTQSAGLTDFLMHDGAGRYRQPLVHYLEAIYTGSATASTLSQLTGTSYDALDREYRQFMSTSDARKESP